MAIPQGYTLDQSDSSPQTNSAIPSGYVLDSQEQTPEAQNPISAIENAYTAGKVAYQAASNLAPWNQASDIVRNVGNDVVEGSGYLGAKVANNTVPYIPNMPFVGKQIQAGGLALGSGIALSPQILAAYTSLDGLYNPSNPVGVGLTNSTKDISPQYTAQNEAVGISNQPPEQSGSLKFPNPYGENQITSKPPTPIQTDTTFPSNLKSADALPSTTPTKYPSNPATLINTADNRVTQFGTNLNQQELADYKALLDQNIGDPNKIPQFIDGKKNPLYAQASAVRAKVVNTLNQVVDPKLANVELPQNTIPTRTGLNQAYGIAAKRQQLGQLLKNYGVGIAEGAGALGGIGSGAYALYKYLNGDNGH